MNPTFFTVKRSSVKIERSLYCPKSGLIGFYSTELWIFFFVNNFSFFKLFRSALDKNQYEDGRLTAAALINFKGRGRTTPRFLESGLTKIDLIHNFKIIVNLTGLIKN